MHRCIFGLYSITISTTIQLPHKPSVQKTGTKSATREAKFRAPHLAVSLPRPRLFARLDDCADVPLAWISAAPGMGKTTLLASYLAQHAQPFLWYRCDGNDTALSKFYADLTRACTACLGADLMLPTYSRDMWPNTARYAEAFFDALYASCPTPFSIVFDNVEQQNLEAIETAIFAATTGAIPGVRIFVGARPMPGPDCLALAARQRLVIFTDAALAFDEVETRQLAERVGVAPQFLVAAAQRLKGWAAGLTLAYTFERMRANDPFLANVPTEGSASFAFFARAVYDALPAATQRVLMATFMLREIDADWASALTADRLAMTRLGELHAANLFVESARATPPLYRYHPAFAEFLAEQALQSLGAEGKRAAYESAAAHALGKREKEIALAFFFEAKVWPRTIELLETLVEPMIAAGRTDQLYQWLQTIPMPLLVDRPALLYHLGLLGTWCEDAKAVDALVTAAEVFERSADRVMMLKAAAAIVDFAYYEWATFRAYDRWVAQLAQVDTGFLDRLPARDAVAIARGIVCAALVSDHPMQHIDAIIAREGEWLASAAPAVRLQALSQALEYVSNARDWVRANVIIANMVELVDSPVMPIALRTRALARRSYYFDYRRGDYQRAADLAREAVLLARQHSLRFSEREGTITLSLVALMQGKIDEARAAINAELACARLGDLAARGNTHYELAWWYALQNDVVSAQREHDLAIALFTESGEAGVMALATPMQQSQLCVLRGEYEHALVLMKSAPGSDSPMWRAQHALLLAAWRIAMHDETGAISPLADGLAIARKHELIGTLWALRSHCSTLLALALAHDIETAWARQMIAARQLAPPENRTGRWPWLLQVGMVGPLTLSASANDQACIGRPRKLIELLCLILVSPDDSNISRIGAQLWPDADSVSVRRSLDTTLHRLRAWLPAADLIVVRDGDLFVDRRRVWVDTDALSALHETILRYGPFSNDNLRAFADEFMGLYRGRFGASLDNKASWVRDATERISTLIDALVLGIGGGLESHHDWEYADGLYQHALHHQPVNEFFLRGRLRCLLARGEHSLAATVFREGEAALKRTHGVRPSAETRALLGL